MAVEVILVDFWPTHWLIVGVNSVLGLLHCLVVGNVTEVSEVHAVSIFRIDV
jgi:hypothetical protein